MRSRQAYALIEVFIVLLCIPLVFSLCVSVFRVMVNYDYDLVSRQNMIGIIQLRRRLLLGSKIEVTDHRISMVYRNEAVELVCEQDKLYEINGYVLYLDALESCKFIQKGNLIYLDLRTSDQHTLIFIAYDA